MQNFLSLSGGMFFFFKNFFWSKWYTVGELFLHSFWNLDNPKKISSLNWSFLGEDSSYQEGSVVITDNGAEVTDTLPSRFLHSMAGLGTALQVGGYRGDVGLNEGSVRFQWIPKVIHC